MAEDRVEQAPRKTYCWVDSSRICGGDCEAFDPHGAVDVRGENTGCRLVNSSMMIARGAWALGKWLSENRSKPTGADIKPPKVG